MRRNLNFRESDEEELRADNFLEKNCPRRSGSHFCAVAINELVEKYGLENASAEDIAKFLNFHSFYKVTSQFTPATVVMAPQSVPNATLSNNSSSNNADINTVKEHSLVSKEAKTVMDDVMASLFGQ